MPSIKTLVGNQQHDTKRPADMNHDFLLNIKLRSHPRLLCVLRGAMEPLLEELGFSQEECRSIIRAIDEAVSNIMRHSYGGRLDRPIEVSCRSLRRRSHGKGGQGVEFLLFDRGPAVDPTKLPGRPLGELRCGGLGLHLIRGGMDRVEYKRTANRNRLRLIKYSRSSKQRPNPPRRGHHEDFYSPSR
jgi:serine/threonine-protein kinase RsbW